MRIRLSWLVLLLFGSGDGCACVLKSERDSLGEPPKKWIDWSTPFFQGVEIRTRDPQGTSERLAASINGAKVLPRPRASSSTSTGRGAGPVEVNSLTQVDVVWAEPSPPREIDKPELGPWSVDVCGIYGMRKKGR